MGKPTPIGDLMADYEANGCDFTDLAWVRAAARGYVKTMPDSQVRCLLHVLAQTTAEAQAQGGGDAVKAVYEKWKWLILSRCADEFIADLHALTAPPSAPVGVAADILRIVDTAIDVCNDRDRPAMAEDLEAVRLYVEQASAALAQQPAAVDWVCAWTVDVDSEAWDGAFGAKWQFTDGGPVENDMRHCPQCGKRIAAQTGGSDNE